MPLALLLLVLVLVGLAFVIYVFSLGSGYPQSEVKHGEELREADELQDELAVIESEITNQGFIQLTCGRSEATALFDPVNEVVHLKCDDLGSRTEGCPSQEHAEILFLEFVIEELELLKDKPVFTGFALPFCGRGLDLNPMDFLTGIHQ